MSGRPRDPQRDAAILRAALELVVERGFGLSIEEVALRAGVAKTTVYRRFASKDELVIAALAAATAPQPVPDTGSFREDLLAYTRQRVANAQAINSPLLFVRLLGDLWRNPALLAGVTERVVVPGRAPIHTMIERGIARGELRADLDRDLMVDVIAGGPVYRMLASGNLAAVQVHLDGYLDAALGGLVRRAEGTA